MPFTPEESERANKLLVELANAAVKGSLCTYKAIIDDATVIVVAEATQGIGGLVDVRPLCFASQELFERMIVPGADSES